MRQKIRRVRFGIRFKFSLIMIAGVSFTALLIALGVFNQQEKQVNESIMKWGMTFLKEPTDKAALFLLKEQLLFSKKAAHLNPWERAAAVKLMNDSRNSLKGYFSSTVQKEHGIDIAFLISTRWSDLKTDWNLFDQSFFRYYNRKTGDFFVAGGGRNDEKLKPSIFSYYMNNLDLNANIQFISAQSQDIKKKYIIVGFPLFRNNIKIYQDYLDWRKIKVLARGDAEKREKEKQLISLAFMDRIMSQSENLEYDIIINKEKERRILFKLLIQHYTMAHLSPARRAELETEFIKGIDDRISHSRLSLPSVREIVIAIVKKYSLRSVVMKRDDPFDQWRQFYLSLRYMGIAVAPRQKLDDLALVAYRTDLIGIQGMFLTRSVFYGVIDKNREEMLNLILSVLLRCVIIAVFFPTFILRSISSLAEKAYEIGRGNLDLKIDMKGSDEIGRLADILNVMTRNVKKARDEIIEKRRMESELLTAREIQAALLPRDFPKVKGVEFGAYYSAQTESGGDYYDFIMMSDSRLGIAMADVSGHGVGSGLVMAMTRTLLHVYCDSSKNTSELLSILNDYLYKNTESNYFVTMFYCVLDLDSRVMRYSSAGHMPGIVLRKNSLNEIEPGGVPLGATEGEIFDPLVESRTVKLATGDYFIQYTDGVIESMDADRNEYGDERFHKALLVNYGKKPDELIQAVMDDINTFTGKIPQHDDVTMIVVKIS